MRVLEIISLLEGAKTESEKIEVLRKSFLEIQDLALVPASEQKRYASMILEKVGEKPTIETVLQAFFELGKLCHNSNSTSRPAGW